jgi:hypothetical protein
MRAWVLRHRAAALLPCTCTPNSDPASASPTHVVARTVAQSVGRQPPSRHFRHDAQHYHAHVHTHIHMRIHTHI